MKKLLLGCVAVASLLAVSAKAKSPLYETFETDNGTEYKLDLNSIMSQESGGGVFAHVSVAEGDGEFNTQEYYFDCHGHMETSRQRMYVPPKSVGGVIAKRVCSIAHSTSPPSLLSPSLSPKPTLSGRPLDSLILHNQCSRDGNSSICLTNLKHEILTLKNNPVLDSADLSYIKPGEVLRLKCPEISLDDRSVLIQLVKYMEFTQTDIPKRDYSATARADLSITIGCKVAGKPT